MTWIGGKKARESAGNTDGENAPSNSHTTSLVARFLYDAWRVWSPSLRSAIEAL